MHTRLITPLALFAGLVLWSASAVAGITTYTSRAAFNAAAGPTILETFNQYNSEVSFETAPLDVGPFTLSVAGLSSGDRNFIDLPPPQFSEFNVDGTPIANTFTSADTSVIYTFDTPILSFGADFASFNNNFFRTNIVVNGQLIAPPVAGVFDVRFFGFVSDVAFSVVEFRGLSNDGFGVDNVSFGPATVVPEPATLGLGSLAALLGLARVAAKRRRAIA